MKRREFVLEPAAAGHCPKRHGAAHDLNFNPRTGRTVPVPRHTEIRDTLARSIRKQLGFDA